MTLQQKDVVMEIQAMISMEPSGLENKELTMAQQKLVADYLPLSHLITRRVHVKLPADIDFDDLCGRGLDGLIEAAISFDPKIGVSFATYAKKFILGRIVDRLRKLDVLSKEKRKRVRILEKQVSDLAQILGRNPTNEEVSTWFGIDIKLVNQIRPYLFFSSDIISIDQTLFVRGQHKVGSLTVGETIEDQRVTPEEEILFTEVKNIVDDLLGELSVRDRKVVELYFTENLTMEEIKPHVNLSAARISQIITESLQKMKVLLEEKYKIRRLDQII